MNNEIKSKAKKKIIHVTPYLIVIASFAFVIILGTLLLMLPISSKDGNSIGFIDALFTTVSASCVTGLSTIDVANQLSIFGKIILAILMEVGGLSFLTFAFFIMVILGRKVGITSRFLMKEALNQNSSNGVMKLIRKIVSISLGIQVVFWVINSIILAKYYSGFECLAISAFHTISSFNNAGFDVFGSNNSMIGFSDDYLLNISTMILIVLGGLGFIVLVDVFGKRKNKDLSFHTKVVLSSTIVLLIGGALLFKLTMGSSVTWLEAFFTSVTARTAGFTTIDFKSVMSDNPSFVIMLILMFIGASPCSTGGGVKTTTIFTILVTLFYLAKGQKPKAFKRSFSEESIIKAFALVTFSLFYVLILVFGLMWIERGQIDAGIMSSTDIIFESVSAFGTVGVSMGITPLLSTASKILICITMFIGRLGPLTVISIWNQRWMQNTSEEVKYIEEKIIIG